MRVFLQVMALFAAYAATALFGLQLDAVSGFATLVWPPTGIALAALLLFGRKLWPGIFLGAFIVNLYTGAPILSALGIAAGNTLEPVIGAWLLQRAAFRNPMERLYDVVALIALAAAGSTLVSATIGVTSLQLGGIVAPGAFFATWQAWWVGDMLGALIVAPLLLTWLSPRAGERPSPWRVIEGLALAAALFGICQLVFGLLGGGQGDAAIAYLVFLPLTWAAIRFGLRGTTTAVFALSALAIWATIRGSGPFVREDLSDSLLYLQTFMGSIAASALILAASIAERKRAEEETRLLYAELKREKRVLEENKRKDDALLASIAEGVIGVDQRGRVTAMNRAAEAMLGFRLADFEGKPITRHLQVLDAGGATVPEKQRPLMLALSSGKTVDVPVSTGLQIVRKDGKKVHIAATAAPVVLDYVRGAVLVFRDASKEAEIDKVKSEFVSLATHQLRDPATIIRWQIEALMKDRAAFGEDDRNRLEDAHRGSLLMTELVDDLLNVLKLETGGGRLAAEEVDVAAMAKDILQEFAPAIGRKGLKLHARYGKDLPAAAGDEKFSRIIIRNLISNAVKYSRPDTDLVVKVEAAHAGDEAGGKELRRGGVLLTVADQGIGIPERQQGQVFSRFFQADNAAAAGLGGTGLSLYLTKNVAVRTGGDVWFESEEDKGSTFYLLLPAAGS